MRVRSDSRGLERGAPPARNSGCEKESARAFIASAKSPNGSATQHAAAGRVWPIAHRRDGAAGRRLSGCVLTPGLGRAVYPLGPLRLLRGLVGAERLERHVKVAHVQAAAAARPRWSRK